MLNFFFAIRRGLPGMKFAGNLLFSKTTTDGHPYLLLSLHPPPSPSSKIGKVCFCNDYKKKRDRSFNFHRELFPSEWLKFGFSSSIINVKNSVYGRLSEWPWNHEGFLFYGHGIRSSVPPLYLFEGRCDRRSGGFPVGFSLGRRWVWQRGICEIWNWCWVSRWRLRLEKRGHGRMIHDIWQNRWINQIFWHGLITLIFHRP